MSCIVRMAVAATVSLLAGCASVASVGNRVNTEGELKVGKLQVYSFVPLHTMGSDRLHRDARRFDGALADRLQTGQVEAKVEDVEELVRRHGLALDVTVADREGRRQSTVLPEKELLTAQRYAESAAGASHRLVILPSRMAIDRATGVTYGVLTWRVEATGDASPVAVGMLRYTADVRGFPARRMASVLVTKLNSLGIR